MSGQLRSVLTAKRAGLPLRNAGRWSAPAPSLPGLSVETRGRPQVLLLGAGGNKEKPHRSGAVSPVALKRGPWSDLMPDSTSLRSLSVNCFTEQKKPPVSRRPGDSFTGSTRRRVVSLLRPRQGTGEKKSPAETGLSSMFSPTGPAYRRADLAQRGRSPPDDPTRADRA